MLLPYVPLGMSTSSIEAEKENHLTLIHAQWHTSIGGEKD